MAASRQTSRSCEPDILTAGGDEAVQSGGSLAWKEKNVMKDGMICNCKQVSYADVENALHQMTSFSDVLSAFEDVQKITHCSTGCGGCHDKILDAISEIMMK